MRKILHVNVALLTSMAISGNALRRFSMTEILRRKKQGEKKKSPPKVPFQSSNHHYDDVQELFLDQRLDHFRSDHPPNAPPLTFSQRYFYSNRYVYLHSQPSLRRNDASSTPTYALLCVGGEGPDLDASVLVDSVHCSGDMLEIASILHEERLANVHVFALEHRYYGRSYPDLFGKESPVDNENLVYLSSKQALADLAHFVQYAKDLYNLSDDVPFITFGGSYPGVLAAWSRLKFPHLIHAAVSNSAPLQVILDFPQYLDVMANDLSNPMVGGSPECLEIVQKGHEEVASLLEGGGSDARENVAEMFHLCNGAESLEDEKSLRAFLGDGVIDIDVQDNDPSCQGDLCNIGKMCDFIVSESRGSDSNSNSTSPMEVLSKLSGLQQSNGECKNISWEDMMDYIASPEYGKEGGLRSWLWQTCTEMGFYQTCEIGTNCPFGKGYHTLDADLEICERAFGIDAASVAQNVQDTLEYYGGWNIESSRILSVNGDIDPWSSMSYSNSGRSEDGLDSYWSIGASHHFWTHKVTSTDELGILNTRRFIYEWVLGLLDGLDTDVGGKEEHMNWSTE